MLKIVSDKYTNIVLHNNHCFAFNRLFQYTDITGQIDYIEVIGKCSKGSKIGIVRGILGTLLQSFSNKSRIIVQFLVILQNKTGFIIETDELPIIEFFSQFNGPPKKNRRRK